jgi:hypothetical protein
MKGILILLAFVFGVSSAANAQSSTVKKKSSSKASKKIETDHSLWNDLQQPNQSVVAYLGIYNVMVYPLPVTFGGDYRMLVPNHSDWALRAGFLYWSVAGWSAFGGTASLFNLNVGAGHVWTIKRVEIEGGARLGYDTFKVQHDFTGWDVFGKSGSSLDIAPYASGTFKFTAEWSAGVEFRFPFYFTGGGLLLNQPYILTQGQYHF